MFSRPGEVSLQRKGFTKSPPVLYASRHNPGASTAAALLCAGIPALKCVEERPMLIAEILMASGGEPEAQLRAESRRNSRDRRNPGGEAAGTAPSHLLLYLAHETWVGAAGEELAREVRAARAGGLRIVMLHENDAEHGRCEFSRFFATTPGDLIQGGIHSMAKTESRLGRAAYRHHSLLT